MAGYGENQNLLGSSLSQYNAPILFEVNNSESFTGLGFGFEKQYLPGDLKEFNQRIGRFVLRFAQNKSSLGITFKNDFKGGKLLLGDATDFGDTGSLYINYTRIHNGGEASQFGFVIQLFTPKPDYGRIANNQRNSDDGRKNAWHTTGVYKEVFYANTFVSYKYQNQYGVYQSKLGMESNKLGAYIQNNLHDGFGLNPRYPWFVDRKDKLFVELEGQYFINPTR